MNQDNQAIKFWNIPFLVLLLGALVTVFNISVTNVALPDIATELNASGLQIHLIADGLTIMLASFVLIMGALGDRYGRKRLFLLGCVVMFVASIASSFASNANILVFWRMIAGIATAMLYPTTLSMTTTIFKNPKQRLLAIGMWSGVSAGGAAVGPIIAGLLLEFFSWGSVFLVSAPFMLLALIIGWRFLPEFKNTVSPPAVDYIGGVLSVVFVCLLLFVIIIYPVSGFDIKFQILLAISMFALLLFIIWEKKSNHPLLNLSVFKNSRFSVGALSITIVAFAQLGVMFLAQQFVQNVLGYTPLQAGLSTLPLAVAVLVASPISARLDYKFGSKKIISLGFCLIGIGFITALFWTTHSLYWQIFLSYVFIGTGLGFTMTPSTNAIMNSLPSNKAGIASAINDVTRDFGSSLGIAVNGSIAALTYTKIMEQVYNNVPTNQQVQMSENIANTILGSLSGALDIANRYPGPDATKLVAAAGQAFLDGQTEAMLLSVILCFMGVGIALIFMPEKQIS